MYAKHLLGRLSLFAAACALIPFHAHAEQTWREVRSPHFHVITDGSEKDGRRVAQEFEQMHQIFTVLLKRPDFESGAPLTIFAARNADTFRELEPGLWKAQGNRIAGEFHGGWEKQFAMVRLDTWSDDNQTVIYHEYTHSVLHANYHWLPVWLDEGLAEYYGNTRFESDRTLIGAPSVRARVLRYQPPLPIETLIEATRRSKVYTGEADQQIFYAQSWAMVHYMMFGDGMERGHKLMQFMSRLQAGEPQLKVFTEIFGPPKAFGAALQQYLNHFAMTVGALQPGEPLQAAGFSVHTLTPAETAYELACFDIGEGRRATGKSLLEQSISLDPKLAGPHEELGYLAFERGDDELALREWRQALTLDPTLARSTFAVTMMGKPLASQNALELAKTKEALHHVTELDPRFAPAYIELALADWRLHDMNLAYKEASKAESLAPWRAGYHVLTARILLEGHQPALASQYARYVASHWEGPDHDEAVDLWNDVPATNRGTGEALALDVPSGTRAVRGTLSTIQCPTEPKSRFELTLQPADSKEAALHLTAGSASPAAGPTRSGGGRTTSTCATT